MELLVFAALLLAGAYLLDVLVWPNRPCRICRGKGRHVSPLPFARDASRPCWWCQGASRRARWRWLRR